ncbi:MAG: cysteine--tRNA ligase [Actinobacteria bacterium]|nr:cysteine--tRNA ligase [Actinomycetota bacterium]
MSIKAYNTLTRKKEELVPREEGKVSMYVCGPTVYNYIHIGNARTFINFDMIRRYLRFAGFEVTYVQNITDVDDKIIGKASEEGVSTGAVAEKYRVAFEEDMAALGIEPPDIAPRATECIPDMLEFIEALLEKGYAYESDGDVYFEVEKFADYGKLSRRNLEEQRMTVQCEVEAARKRDPFDFALWKASKPGEPSWESPWGPGRPGWHIECSTMSIKYLGTGFDIHGGGQDLIFPHHENEIAQSEAYADGALFVRYWLHSGMLNIDREKMSKSLGNIELLRDILSEHDADTVRMLMLGTHYRSPLSFGDNSLAEAHASLSRIRNCAFNLEDLIRKAEGEKAGLHHSDRQTMLVHFLNEAEDEFRKHMDDDFNSAAALGVVFGVVREINSYLDEAGDIKTPAGKLVLLEARRVLDGLCGALGLFQGAAEAESSVERVPAAGGPAGAQGPSREQLIELLLRVRETAREGRNFEFADRIRDGLAELGVRVEDVQDGFRWRLER